MGASGWVGEGQAEGGRGAERGGGCGEGEIQILCTLQYTVQYIIYIYVVTKKLGVAHARM